MMAKRRVLVVDDEPDMRIYLTAIVETLGHLPIAAADALQAWAKASAQSPDLVILDVMIPKIEDGIQTYQRLRSDSRLSSVPIIVVSAIARKTFLHAIRILDPAKGLHATEPEAYVEKPPDAEELGRLITRFLRHPAERAT